MKTNCGLFIDGQFVEQIVGETFEVMNPADLSIVGKAAKASIDDTRNAIKSSHIAGNKWSALGSANRGNVLEKCINAMESSIEELGKLLTLEHGKPLSEAIGEVKGSLYYLKYFAEQSKRIHGDLPPQKSTSTRSMVLKQPRGVVAAITPWNYPMALSSWKIGAALAAGCTVVLKPPSDAPLATTKFFGNLSQAGLPPGVLNVITGSSSEIGTEMIENPLVKVIAFTGSTQTGKQIAKQAAGSLKKLILELGGQTPLVVFGDADLEQAVPLAVKRSFRNMGQICNAVNRIYVEEPIAEEFLSMFVSETKKLRIGFGIENEKYDLGPMTNQEGIDRVLEHISDAKEKGGRIVYGGKRPQDPILPGGYFFEPTIIDQVTEDMLVMKEETFGPVVGIDKFSGVKEALRKANSTRYGLVCYAFTESLKIAYSFMEGAKFGSVGINTISPDSPYAPYPAWKDSGEGAELGTYGIEEFMQLKHCILDVGF
jgi:acyl-CoA reductase-like NAD-dependent aldehyde dehydrogenase